MDNAGIVAWNFGAVDQSGRQLVTSSGALKQAIVDMQAALNPVRESWYKSGSVSGQQAQAAEGRLVTSFTEMIEIIRIIGQFLSTSASEVQDFDGKLGQDFEKLGVGRSMAMNTQHNSGSAFA